MGTGGFLAIVGKWCLGYLTGGGIYDIYDSPCFYAYDRLHTSLRLIRRLSQRDPPGAAPQSL